MKVLTLPNWHALMRAPIVTGLLLSACVHLAAIVLLQPAPGSMMAQTVVISARLEPLERPLAPAVPETTASPPPGQTPAPASPPAPAPELPIPPELPPQPPASVQAAAPIPASPPPVPVAAPAQDARTAPTRAAAVSPASPGPDRPATPLPSVPLGVDTTWYLARQVDVQPRAIGKVEPVYPPEARRRNQEGSLKLMVRIDDLGRVQSAEVVEAHPAGMFEEAALDAFRKARFQPALRDGRPVRMQAYIRMDFKLED